MTRVAVLGAGSWGTAFSAVLADAGCRPILWARRNELVEEIRRSRANPDYLPGVVLPAAVEVTADAAAAIAGSDVVVVAVPSQTLRENLQQWRHLLPSDRPVISLLKGIELGTSKRMSEVLVEAGGVAPDRVAVVSGPNLAREIAERQPAASVVACTDEALARQLQQLCTTAYFRPYTLTDVVGCELGGAVKNVIALAVGMAEGMGLGDNARASLITRGLAETARLGAALGADPLTFAGLAGLGDLVATCFSPLSRNRTVGEQLGRGRSLPEIQGEMRTVAEGVASAEPVLGLAQHHGVEMPIIEQVAAVVAAGRPPGDLVARLMSRETKSEKHGWRTS